MSFFYRQVFRRDKEVRIIIDKSVEFYKKGDYI